MRTAYSRALIYPGATAFAYINEIELRQIRARSRVFGQTNPYAIGAAATAWPTSWGSGHTYKVLPRDPGDAGEELLDGLPQGAGGLPQAEQVEQAAERDRPPPGPRRRAVPAAVRRPRAGRAERPLRRAVGSAEPAATRPRPTASTSASSSSASRRGRKIRSTTSKRRSITSS